MRLPLSNGLLFVHTPKTAGTSFRHALEESLGVDNVFYDYGTVSVVTSQLALEYAYQQRRFPELARVLQRRGGRFCWGGHFSAKKYAPLFQSRNIIMFVRDPVERFVSDYGHHCRVHGYKKDLQAFCQEPSTANVQSRYLGDFPLELVGFLGIQERYSETLVMMRDFYDLELPELAANVNREKQSEKYELSPELYQCVQEVNQKDSALYQRACALYQERVRLFSFGLPYTYGNVDGFSVRRARGWAFSSGHDDPVAVDVLVDGVVVKQVLATEYMPALRAWSSARSGYVGFEASFPVNDPLPAGGMLECRVAATGQKLVGGGVL